MLVLQYLLAGGSPTPAGMITATSRGSDEDTRIVTSNMIYDVIYWWSFLVAWV